MYKLIFRKFLGKEKKSMFKLKIILNLIFKLVALNYYFIYHTMSSGFLLIIFDNITVDFNTIIIVFDTFLFYNYTIDYFYY